MKKTSKPLPPGVQLDDVAAEIYDDAYRLLTAPVSPIDRHHLAVFAQSTADYWRLTALIADEGDTVSGTDGQDRKHPLGIPQSKAFANADQAAKALGLDRKTRLAALAAQKDKKGKTSLRKLPRSATKKVSN